MIDIWNIPTHRKHFDLDSFSFCYLATRETWYIKKLKWETTTIFVVKYNMTKKYSFRIFDYFVLDKNILSRRCKVSLWQKYFATTNIPASHRLTKINKSIFADLRRLQKKIRNIDIIDTNFLWLNDTSAIKKFERWQNGVSFIHCKILPTVPIFVSFYIISRSQLLDI